MIAAEQIQQLLNDYPVTAHARRSFQPKASGGVRPIAHPNKELKAWLRTMSKALRRQFNAWPDFMHGGIKKRSYVTYARPHVNQQCVITVDIKSCFDAITEQEISKALAQHLKLDPTTCTQLASKLCFRGRVAQGFPTSNYLCNLYLLSPLSKVNVNLKGQGIKLGNYVDDIVASGNIKSPNEIVNAIAIALSQAKLKTNKAKVRVMPRTGRQVVCGLLVNRRLSLTTELKISLLAQITHGTMSKESVEGWLANLHNINPSFQKKLYQFADKKGLLRQP